MYVAKKKIFLPDQKKGNHKLDNIVIELAVAALESKGVTVTSVRAIFKEGNKIYPKSAFNRLDHVQIAVRKTDAIQRHWKEA